MEKEVNLGRIRYIEPSNFFNQKEGTYSDAINFPYEDYNMAVDLTIRKVNRYSCGWWNTGGEQNEITYSSKNGSISFLGGTKYNDNDSFLTTNFTDVSMTSPENNTLECFGIESITISYTAWLCPQITIKFVDIRGATVMQPVENNYFNDNNKAASSEIYRALFSFPYPIFILKVKGFYGKGVTYRLAVSKTNFELDSSTGNFNITVDFVGYMFGIYTDIPMTYLAIAPYTMEGKLYWKQKIDEGVFTFKDANGNPTSDMIKIPELRLKLASVANSEESTSAAAEGAKIKNNIEESLNSINNLRESFPFKDWHEEENINYLYTIVPSEMELKNFIKEVSGYVETVKSHDKTYNTKILNILTDLEDYSKKKQDLARIEIINSNNEYTYNPKDKKSKANYEKYIQPYNSISEYIKKNNKGLNYFNVYVFTKNNPQFTFENFYKLLNEESNRLTQKREEYEVEYKNKEDRLIEQALGFKPSVKNIYNLIFAHMETFMHCFYSNTKIIKDQLENNQIKRSKSYYGVNDGDTDTERVVIKTSNGEEENTNPQSKYLPPYAAYYKKVNYNNETKTELRWPGELINGAELEELNFVKELLYASELYYESSANIEKELPYNNTPMGNTPTTVINDFIPLTNYDLMNKDTISNPYDVIRHKINNGLTGIEGEILGIFALRAFSFLSANWDNSNKNAKSFGVIEAINLFKTVKDNYSHEFINFIKKYTNSNRSNKNEFIDIITTTVENVYNKIWGNHSIPSLNKNLFIKQNGNLLLDYHKGVSYETSELDSNHYIKSTIGTNAPCKVKDNYEYKLLPLSFYSFDELKKKYINHKTLVNDSNFIVTNYYNDDYLYSAEENKISTFKLIESRDYIKYLFNTLETEIKNTRVTYDEKEYGNRKNDEYGKIKKSNSVLKKYKKNIESDELSNSYIDGIIVNSKGKNYSSKEIKNVITTGTSETQKDFYIKYPSIMDDTVSNSLIGHKIYSEETNMLVKAYLFLQGLPILDKDENGGIEMFNGNTISLKSKLLREGSYYWREDNNHLFKNNDFKMPTVDECFMTDKNTISLLSPISDSQYKKWAVPVSMSPSRRKILKKYFENWANSNNEEVGFAANEHRLSNKSLYNNELFSNGLNIELVISENISDGAFEAKKLQTFLRNLYFDVHTTLELYDFPNNFYCCTETEMKEAFEGFMDELNLIYKQVKKDLKNNPENFEKKRSAADASNAFKNNDLRLSTYMTLKNLYDKWLCSPYNGPEHTWSLNSINGKSEFENFIYVDSYYHDIGYKINVNISKVSSWLSNCLPTSNLNTSEGVFKYNNRTLYEFLTEVAQHCGATLMALPHKFGLNNSDNIVDMFTPISIQNNWDEDTSSFVFMYSYKNSQHLGNCDNGNIDMNGWSLDGDGIDLTNEEIVGSLFNDEGYDIPAFAVTYAKQNQSLFKNVRLSSESLGVTEASIAATFNIASKGSESPRESTLYGQDIYRVFSNYSFNCEVEAMGNLQITPLMYFQLNNVPMWKGAYMIQKVTHNISAGNVSTNFEGVRLNKYAIPIVDGRTIIFKDTGKNVDNPKEETMVDNASATTSNTVTASNSVNNSTNNTISNITNIPGNLHKIESINTDIYFDKNNITEKKPVICLTPAHSSKKTGKLMESIWSARVVDRIVEYLKDEKFYDGTSFAQNIIRCNKDRTKVDRVMGEARKVVNAFGSKRVISVVPHWNGGAGSYYLILLNKNKEKVREDSKILAECMKNEADKIIQNKDKLTKLPDGAIGDNIYVKNLNINNTDEAPQLDCACILTENWFADYPPQNGQWAKSSYGEIKNGKYVTGRGWLENDGIDVIAKAHANAIKNYINSLNNA